MKILAVTTSNERTREQTFQEVPLSKIKKNDSKLYLGGKRIIDIICSVLGIILLSPLFLTVAILIKVEDSDGPIFFKQVRTGKDGKQFKMYKFRSMISNAEELKASLMQQNEAEGPVFKIKDDPRVIKIGKLIRKTSIDELPQLFNVLKGEMSLVGPRPPLPEEVEQYTRYEKQRLSVTPGLTCYWQVNGRSNISFDEWVELDLKYINERNLRVDIILIIKTLFVLLGSKNAY